jgi:hypothetical protein
MEEKALFNFVNEACKQNDTDFDASFTKMVSAFDILEREKAKRKAKKRNDLIDAFKDAYRNLIKEGIQVNYDFEMDYLENQISKWSDTAVLILDDTDAFEFLY